MNILLLPPKTEITVIVTRTRLIGFLKISYRIEEQSCLKH